METGLVTHGYKTITLHEKVMSYVLSHEFCFFVYRNITKFCRSIYFCIGYSDILNKLAAIVYCPCLKKQTLQLLLHLLFKAELPANGFQDVSFLVLNSIQT